MELNTFGAELLKALGRIAGALEASAGSVNTSGPADTTGEKIESVADKKKRLAAEKKAADEAAAAAAAASKAPKADRAAVNKALVTLKDTVSKEAAQEVFKAFGYAAMSKIEDKDFDAILAAATKELEDFANKTGKYAADDAPLDDGDDDL